MKRAKMYWWRLRKKMGSPILLCDTCKLDYHTVCKDPKRPNATECEDYQKR